MPIISARDNENNRWKRNGKKKRIKNKGRGKEAIVKGWELNDSVVHLSILQLICKASVILKSNLELALSIILKPTKRIIRVKACYGGV